MSVLDQAAARRLAGLGAAFPATPHDLRIEHDAFGRPVRVFVGPLEVTHLVARVQTNTTINGTFTEVVLTNTTQAPRAPRITTAAELRQQAKSDPSCVGAFARARPGAKP